MKHAFRSLLKSPGFTSIALLTLALGIGVNTSMFTVLNTLLLQDTPFAQPTELVRIFRTAPQSRTWPHSVANFLDTQAQSQSFTALAGYNNTNYNYSAADQPAERLRGMDVTGNFFTLLGIAPQLGRTFTAGESASGAAPTVVLSHGCWQQRFGADPAVIGRQIRLNSQLVTVIGVMPPSFVPQLMWGPIDAWQPLTFNAAQQQNRSSNFMSVIGRLKPGVALASAQAELTGIAARLAQTYPLTNSENGLRLVPLANSTQDDASRSLTWLVMGLAGFVLLIACANLANLQFTRTASRAREHAIRSALGASRWQVMRQLLAESLLLGLVGGALGLLVAVWCNDLLSRHISVGRDVGLALPLDLRVLAFTLVASTFSGLAFGLIPAWLAARTDVNDALKLGSRGVVAGATRLRHSLIVIEVALALVLLAGAGVFLRGFERFTHRDPGWQTDGLLTGFINLPATKYRDDASRRAFFAKLDANLAAQPLIARAALASSLPTRGYSSSLGFLVLGQPAPAPGREPLANYVCVTPGYFETLGIRLLQGRTFTAADTADRPTYIVINETMARTLWPNQNPIGQRIGGNEPDDPVREVIGVVTDVAAPASLGTPDTRFQLYVAISQETFGLATIAVRGRVADEKQLTAAIRAAVAAIDPDQPVHSITTVRADVGRALVNFTLIGGLLAGFAVLGLVLAALGIYGVLASFVVQRTQEIGIRMALGAQVGTVLRLILARGLGLSLLGLVIGLAGAWAVVHLFGTILPEMGSPDPLTFAAIIIALLTVAALACYLPARRATKVDPLIALRAE